jgi:hypothetical protein
MIKPGRLCQLLSWARIEYSLLGAHPYNLPGRSLTLHTWAPIPILRLGAYFFHAWSPILNVKKVVHA